MRLRRTSDGRALPGAGFHALGCALATVAWVIVGRTKVRQAVIVAWTKVVHRIRAWASAQVADVAVELEDGPAPASLPVSREAPASTGTLPTAAGHDLASPLQLVFKLTRLYNHGEIGLTEWADGLEEAAELARREI